MYHIPTYIAGMLCLNPHTESETFLWFAVLGGLILVALSLFLGIVVLVIKIRKTSGPIRIVWLRRYGFSILTFFFLALFGWSTGSKASDTDICNSALPSVHGTMINLLMVLTLLASLLFILAYTLNLKIGMKDKLYSNH